MSLVAVIVKKNRVAQGGSHTYKYQGGVLDTTACRKRGYYLRRMNGQEQGDLLNRLSSIVEKQLTV